MTLDYRGRTALVTGASSGIGEGLARGLAARGASLLLVSRSGARLEEIAAGLREAHGVQARALPADLGVPAERERLVAEAGQVDVLVNNAGQGTHGLFTEIAPERELSQVELNVTALVHLTRLLLPGMVERRSGGLLNVGSTAGFQPIPGMATYAATKAFVLSFTQALAEEVRGTGVHVTALCPGAVRTPFFDKVGSEDLRHAPMQLTSMSVDEVVPVALDALAKGRRLAVPGLANRVGTVGARLVPLSVAARIGRRAVAL